MRGLDDTDRQILDELLQDARKPFSQIADSVDLSAPAVSDRVDRLTELGVIERFTVDVDRSTLHDGVSVLIDLQVRPGEGATVAADLQRADRVEHVFTTADARVLCTATVRDGDVPAYLKTVLDFRVVDEFDVNLLTDTSWTPRMGDASLAVECAECGNTVTSEGATTTLGGERYDFCCESCESKFVEQYERLSESA
jgi:DNA-binding Lrp family transcriptional regulator